MNSTDHPEHDIAKPVSSCMYTCTMLFDICSWLNLQSMYRCSLANLHNQNWFRQKRAWKYEKPSDIHPPRPTARILQACLMALVHRLSAVVARILIIPAVVNGRHGNAAAPRRLLNISNHTGGLTSTWQLNGQTGKNIDWLAFVEVSTGRPSLDGHVSRLVIDEGGV